MKGKIALTMVALVTIALLAGCAEVLKVNIPGVKEAPKIGSLSRIGIEGITVVNVGGSANLTAKGYDGDGNSTSVNPTWTVAAPTVGDMGQVEITPSIGANVTVKGVKTGYVNIVVEDRGVKKVKEAFEIR